VLLDLVQNEIQNILDQDAWDAREEQEQLARDQLGAVAAYWERVMDDLGDYDGED
jgi:hypothetical protein